jgi:hypothetical protein
MVGKRQLSFAIRTVLTRAQIPAFAVGYPAARSNGSRRKECVVSFCACSQVGA